MWRFFLLALIVGGLLVVPSTMAAPEKPEDVRAQAERAQKNGNWNDAYKLYSKLALDPANIGAVAGYDLQNGVQCLAQLGRQEEADAFREQAIASHPKDWAMLEQAANSYNQEQHYGFIVAGKFVRSNNGRSDGKQVNSFERDRVRALQLMSQGLGALEAGKVADTDKASAAQFYFDFANMLLNGYNGSQAWKLQALTDLSTLPDYEEGYGYYGGWRGYGESNRGAPVDAQGNPILHQLPKSWATAQSDGQRWRWCLLQAAELGKTNEVRFTYANFLREQFGVQTMAYGGFGGMVGRGGDTKDDQDGKKDEAGPYAVSTLGEEETIARLANGIKRFKLTEESNYIKLFQTLAVGNKLDNSDAYAANALEALGQIFEDRQQYPRAAEYWKECITRFGPGNDNYRQKRLEQIVKNWGQFESLPSQTAEANPLIGFRFRNAPKVTFTATRLDMPQLLRDVKAYLKTDPFNKDRNDWYQKVDIGNIGYRIIERNEKKYLLDEAAKWELKLEPKPKHFDRVLTITTPDALKTPGAYLVKAEVPEGNTTFIVLWVADTVIVKKPLNNAVLYYVADAVSGSPVAKATVDCFGYRQRHIKDNNYTIDQTEFAEKTDEYGLLILTAKQATNEYQWLITATTEKNEGGGGRFAWYGFSGVWYGQYERDYDYQYKLSKAFFISDRPVYRPAQTVKWKWWLNKAQYDQEGPSPYAGQEITVRIMNPRNEKIEEKTYKADSFGGIDGELALPKEAMLGVYSVQVLGIANLNGYGSFRVEEYKKPEFEVGIDAPKEPVMLGEKITSTIHAKYYFGAPVLNAKVKYKVLRTSYSASWYPVGRWDWLFEPGYWWFACDYPWYPGWGRWGCVRPYWSWWGGRAQAQPEVVTEAEVPIGPDGTVKVEIDTAVAKAVLSDVDHKYEISAEVTDESRRTITGSGSVIVARHPFKVYAWVDRGYYRTGDAIGADFSAQTLDNKPVQGNGTLKLMRVGYDKAGLPVETLVQKWTLDTDAEGKAHQQLKAAEAGQYRLSYTVTDSKGHAIEGGYVFVIRDGAFNGKDFRFNDLELTSDQREYKVGDKVQLMVNANRTDSTVLLFIRPSNGIYLPPKMLKISGKSVVETIDIIKKDMPNFFVEALTVSGGHVFTEVRQIVVPPEDRVLKVSVTPSAAEYKPGEKAKFVVKVTEPNGEPFVGSTVVSVYDKAVEYISGGSNVGDIKSFFWNWKRTHYVRTESSADRMGWNLQKSGTDVMGYLGVFGALTLNDLDDVRTGSPSLRYFGVGGGVRGNVMSLGGAADFSLRAGQTMAAPAAPMSMMMGRESKGMKMAEGADGLADKPNEGGGGEAVEPTVRKNFADTALWVAAVSTSKEGTAELELTMPESLTTWRFKAWTMGAGARVGQGEADVITKKNLIIRLQAPRFFVEKDEVVLSANVHNYLKSAKKVRVELQMPSANLISEEQSTLNISSDGHLVWLVKSIEIPAGGEQRVDWRVKVVGEGQPFVRVKALTDEESDAMEMSFPVYVHGMLKTDSYSGALRPEQTSGVINFTVPDARRPEQSRLEVRFSPSVASAMVDALPYLVDYPYGCTEQTLNRFVPTVVTQKILQGMKLDLKAIRDKRTNLNAQQIGDEQTRAAQWKRWDRNPVFDEAEVTDMVKAGITKLTAMQLSDGGWGWFSGYGEYSYPHTTAVVVHGLQVAKANDVAVPPDVLARGIAWLKHYQEKRVAEIKKHRKDGWKADNTDALVYMTLVDADISNSAMRDYLYEDRTGLSVYAKCMFGLALHDQKDQKRLEMILQNISQFVVQDAENQTAYLNLPGGNYWWCWYGAEYESQAYYLKLLAATEPKGPVAAGLAKYLINNRRHATYWNSTRDTAVCIEALAEFIKASGEAEPDLTVKLLLDGKQVKEVKIDRANLFTFDNKLVLTGLEVTSGNHKLEFVKTGNSPLYYNAYLTNFTLEDPITKAGLEIKVQRKFYKLVAVDKRINAEGERGQVLSQKVEKYERQELANLAQLKSGDLVEVELEIDSKNDYEYLIFEDMKPAGFEAVDTRSGYIPNDLHAFVEFRDERVCFFVRELTRGKHSVSYRLRAEIPGKFSALPAKASAMYAPELKGNSDEMKLRISD